MIDQRFLDDLAQDLKLPPDETQPEMQLASANTGVTTDAGGFVGYRLNMPKGLNTRENQAKQSVLIADTLAGAGKGAVQGFVGLPGDLESIGRMALGYLGYNVDENTALPTSEEIGKRLESVLGPVIPPNQTTGVPTAERVRAAEGGTTGGEILAPGGQLKMAGKVVKATKNLPVGMSIKMVDGTEQVLEKAPKIESKAFKSWFGESKVVDEANKPIVVYHGTKDDIDQFMQGKPNKKDAGWLGDGFYFTDNPELASTYAEYLKSGPEGANVLPVYLSIKNPYEATIRDKEYLMMADRRGDKVALKEFTDNLIKQGYDGVVLDYKKQMGVTEPVKEYVAFKPEQIKSVFNKGEFNPQDPRILYGSGVSTGEAMSQEENK
jgi:hypothetical protein